MEGKRESNIIGYPKVISYDCIKEIINQMEKYICKVKIQMEQGSGFFCNTFS